MAFTRNGFGQVEPNQLSAQKTGQIYASLPLDKSVEILQNGEFMYYDYANGCVNAGKAAATGVIATKGEPMLVFNEIKLYEPFWRTSYKDFAMIKVGDNYVTSKLATAEYGENSDVEQATYPSHGKEYGYRMEGFAPRLFKTNVGDIYTTNIDTLIKAFEPDSQVKPFEATTSYATEADLAKFPITSLTSYTGDKQLKTREEFCTNYQDLLSYVMGLLFSLKKETIASIKAEVAGKDMWELIGLLQAPGTNLFNFLNPLFS